jgi:hypothetical protein
MVESREKNNTVSGVSAVADLEVVQCVTLSQSCDFAISIVQR